MGVDGAKESREQLEKDYAAIDTVFPGALRRRLEGGYVNEVLLSAAEGLPQVLLTATPTSLASRTLMKAGIGRTVGALAPSLPMSVASYGGEFSSKNEEAEKLEEMARALQSDLDARQKPGYEAGGIEVEDPKAVEATKAAIAKALSDAQKLRSGARASATLQALINTGTEMISPAHAQGVGRGGLTRMARNFLVEGILKEGVIESGASQVLTNLAEPLVTQGVHRPGVLDGVGVAIGTEVAAHTTHAGLMTVVTPGKVFSNMGGDEGPLIPPNKKSLPFFTIIAPLYRPRQRSSRMRLARWEAAILHVWIDFFLMQPNPICAKRWQIKSRCLRGRRPRRQPMVESPCLTVASTRRTSLPMAPRPSRRLCRIPTHSWQPRTRSTASRQVNSASLDCVRHCHPSICCARPSSAMSLVFQSSFAESQRVTEALRRLKPKCRGSKATSNLTFRQSQSSWRTMDSCKSMTSISRMHR
jgi:hypothetical protein